MQYYLFLFAALLFAEIAWGFHYGDKTAFMDVGNANEFIDQLIEATKMGMSHDLEPYSLPDKSIGFEKKILLVTWRGEAKLYDGLLSGLTTIHRNGDCTIDVQDGNTMHVKVHLGMGVLELRYHATVTFMDFGPSVTVEGKIGYVTINMDISSDPSTGGIPTIEKFDMDEMKGLTVTFNGLGPLSWLMTILTSLVLKFFKGIIKTIIQWTVKRVVADKIKNLQFPIYYK
ncbi:mite allergen Lep d 7-like [Limulus polyphemus]|uniref:Mite allergen Lep d 7-like n=1 Tax=Limulus polyphemus TaxID=6850 RepID=A0ABM1SZA2_LIMPO|nr:mite allergen Lep d 7-like [Limulus polyphemus]XP_022248959.1 mite allergen Lep d 7-like [Limulus polyphemus]